MTRTRTSPSANRRRRAMATVAGAALASGLAVAPTAQATYPGAPGVIVFGAFADGTADLWSVAADGSDLTQLTDSPGSVDICPAVSADGRKVASCRNAGEGFEIWTSDLGGGNDRQVTDLGGWAIFPDWNPRGNRIVFSWAPDEVTPTSLYVVRPRSGKVTPLLVEDGFAHENPVYSPDGTEVLYVRERWEYDEEGSSTTVESQLWVVDVRTGEQRQVTSDSTIKGQTADWSPNGRQIAYAADDDIWIMDADGGKQRNLTQSDTSEFGASFSPDGKWITFTGWLGARGETPRYIQVIRKDGTHRRVVVETPGMNHAVPAWQPVTSRTR